MKRKPYKIIWLLALISLSIILYVSFRFVAASHLNEPLATVDKKTVSLSQAASQSQTVTSKSAPTQNTTVNDTAPTETGKNSTITTFINNINERYIQPISIRFRESFPNWPFAKLSPIAILVALFILMAFFVLVLGKLLYRWYIRRKIYRGYQSLQKICLQLDSTDIKTIDQAIAQLNTLQRHLKKPTASPLFQVSVFCSLCLQIDYFLYYLQEKRKGLVAPMANAQKTAVLQPEPLNLKPLNETLVKFNQSLTRLEQISADLRSVSLAEAKYRTMPSEQSSEIDCSESICSQEQPADDLDRAQDPCPMVEGPSAEATADVLQSQPLLIEELVLPTIDETEQQADLGQQAFTADSDLSLPQGNSHELATAKLKQSLAESTRFLSTKLDKINAWKNKKPDHSIAEIQNPPPSDYCPAPDAKNLKQDLNPRSEAIVKLASSGFWKRKKQAESVTNQQDQTATVAAESIAPSTTVSPDNLADNGQVDDKHQQAQSLVRKHMLAGMALSALPVPLLDVATLTGTQLNLLRSLTNHYGLEFDNKQGRSLVVALLGAVLPTTTLMWLSSLSKSIPGIGTLAGGASLSATAGAVIYATGQVFIKHFEGGGDLQNFNNQQQKSTFQQALKEGTIKAKETVAQSR